MIWIVVTWFVLAFLVWAFVYGATKIMKLQHELSLKQAEIIKNIALNYENKLNGMRQELDFYTSNFAEWKLAYEAHAEELQSAWEKERGGK